MKGTVSSAGNTTGYYSDPIGLLDDVKLTPLVQLSIKHLVRDTLLIVILEWKNSLDIEGYPEAKENAIDGMATIVNLSPKDGVLISLGKFLFHRNQ